ncbi:hypothetical protein HK099_006913 [Clydaea vesicula]|uniref:Activator of Hsp90 ATPase AHSA1-like N-terminal domain-containing protein n=1 Tax=Clydaea vesicula TaxID=447962 RepID=A0AAD5U9B6_9FUNG|nr:hypothetical protein HK099_006913 [Clydaea vesicula]
MSRNVNNWAKDYFRDSLVGISYESSLNGVKVEIEKLSDFTGTKGDTTATGRIKVPEYMHDTELDEIVFEVSVDNETKEKEEIKKVLRSELIKLLREKFAPFQKDLIKHHKADVFLEVFDDKIPGQTKEKYQPKPPAPLLSDNFANKNQVVGGVTKIELDVEFVCSTSDLYSTFLDQKKVQIWTRGGAKVATKVGDEFSFFDDHYSTVTLLFDDKGDATILKLTQTDVPIGEKEIVRNNWHQYYMNPIKSLFGYGANFQVILFTF